jgi:hypothetical protein
MKAELSTLINRIAPSSHVRPEAIQTAQLSLFPELRGAPEQPDSAEAEDIQLPRSVLRISKEEHLSEYLSRVAAAAMFAATRSCGSPAKAALRLGTSSTEFRGQNNDENDGGNQFPALRLVADNSPGSCELERHVHTSR